MKMELLSINGNNFSPNYNAFIIYPRQLRMEATPNILPVAGTYGQYTGKSFGGGFLTIQVKYLTSTPSTQHTYEAEIARWFNTLDTTLYKLLAQDTADSNRQWYVMASAVSVVQENDSAVIVLALEKPYWSVQTAATDSWNITASGQTKNMTSIGERARPVFTITPNLAKSASGVWGYSRFLHLYSDTNYVKPMPVNLGPLDTATLVSGGKALSSGDDFRVLISGVEVSRWFGTGTGGFNQAATNIWIAIPDYKAITLRLGASIPSTSITEIAIRQSSLEVSRMKNMPQSGLICVRGASDVNNEYMYYTGIDLINYKLTGVTRAAKGTTAKTHASTQTLTLVPYDITIIYGNSTAPLPSYDDAQKPVFDLDLSTNTSWVYTEFAQETAPQRTGAWVKSLLSSSLKTSKPYTGASDSDSDPAQVMGLKMATGQVSGIEQGETAKLAWTLGIANGLINAISITGQKYRATSDWPTIKIEGSTDSITWTLVTTITSPSAAGVWEAISAVIGGAGRYVRFIMDGNLAAGAGNKALAELSDVTLTLDTPSSLIPYLKSEVSSYYLDATITNVTTGQAIILKFAMKTGNYIIVDCNKKTVTYSDGSNALNALTLNTERTDWMTFAYGVNQLQYTEVGVTDLTIASSWVAENPV